MARSQKRPADFTGQQAEKLAAEHAAEQAARAQQVAMVTAAAVVEASEPVDYSPAPEVYAPEVEGGEAVVVQPKTVKIRVNSTIEMLTFGHGNHYDFEEGREYVVSKDLADHLEEKGLIWH